MNKDEFVSLIHITLMEHPIWFADAILASQQALINRTEIESNLRSEAWAAMLVAYPAIGKKRKIRPSEKEIIDKVVLKASEGTEFGRRIREEMKQCESKT